MKSLIPFVLALTLLATTLPAATTIEFEDLPWGQLGFAELVSAPYPHSTRDEGFTSRSGTVYPRDPHYIDSSVAFLVPSGFEARATVDLIVYFHGHGTVLRPMIPRFELGEMLSESGLNAILIAPQGPLDASDSRNGKIDEAGGFAALVEESVQALADSGVVTSTEIGRIAITGHSGGFHTLGQIIANGDMADLVKECWLFDASYAQEVHFADFADREGTRLLSIFTGHLSEENVDIMSDLQRRGAPFLFLHDELVTDEQLRENSTVFLHTDLRHMEVLGLTRHMVRWMRASTLDVQ